MSFSFEEAENALPIHMPQLIDESTERRQMHFSTLRPQSNKTAPISFLPPELLCKIFMIVRKDAPKEPEFPRTFVFIVDGKVPNPLEWIVSLTHVNRHWRDVAINSPTLWTIIDDPLLYNIAWLEEVIRRSKEALLTVEFNTTLSEHSMPGLKLVFDIGHRIRHLSFRVYPTDWEIVKGLLPKTALELESLSITHFGSLDDALRETPKLWRLTLPRFDVSFWCRPRASVTHLKLQGTVLTRNRDRNLTWRQFADGFKCMPNLQVLDLEHTLPIRAEERASVTSGFIELPFLKLLRLIVGKPDAEVAERFLSQSSFPSTTSIIIGYHTESALDLQNLFPGRLLGLAQSLSKHAKTFQALVLSDNDLDHDGINLKLFEDALTDEQMLAYRQVMPRLELTIRWLSSSAYLTKHDERANVLNHVFDNGTLLLQSIEIVCLAGILGQSSPIVLAKTIGQLPQLHSLVVAHYTQKELIDALQLRREVKSEDPGVTVYFPNLSSLYLCGTIWNEAIHHKQGNKLVFKQRLSPFKKIYECLYQRQQAGAEMKKLTIKLSFWRYLTPDDVDLHFIDLLKKIVPLDLYWVESQRTCSRS